MNTRNPERAGRSAIEQSFSRALRAAIDQNPASGLLIGYSAGLDSTVLLALARDYCASAGLGLRALYVDHQLHPDSQRWRDHCAATCASMQVEFNSRRVNLGSASRANLESAARDARYAAFATELREREYLLTAHHADDQAETLLLQLLRGAGVRGMAAMPSQRSFAAGWHLRPLLQISREALADYACRRALSWVDDPSNLDARFDRNLLRAQILPLLRERWPAAVQNICRSAAHCASAAELLFDVAAADFAGFEQCVQLPVAPLRALPPARRDNLLRCWIEARGFRPPSTAQLEQIARALVAGADDSVGDVQWGDAQMRRYAADLYLAARGELNDAPAFEHRWEQLDQPLCVPELQVTLAPDCLPSGIGDGALCAHSRRGGERLPGKPQRKQLKKWFQEQRVPPWQRSRFVIFSRDGQVLGIYGPV